MSGLEHLPFDKSLDKKALAATKQRFLEINEGRISRAQQGLNEHHRAFLQVVPILLHVNHPLLPGYISSQTPSGISHFEPNNIHIRALKNIVKSYEYRRSQEIGYQIESLFLMGSTGTVAHSGGSDMDFWVCHRNDLTSEMLVNLQAKLDVISQWAEKISLEVYFFLMDATKFKAGLHSAEIGDENCGSAQHFLLLDEFYRSNLLIAGKYPLWWMVPTEHEIDYETYANWLIKHRFIKKEDVIDFGGIPKIPAGEFFGAGLWQLYKAIDSPFKSVLKILLSETYANEYPNVSPISLIFKEAVHQGVSSLNQLDPYLMVYRKIEGYLRKIKAKDRLDLVRRCLYLKVNVHASKEVQDQNKHWRRVVMQRLVESWDWKLEDTLRLDSRRRWKSLQVIAERKSLVNELNLSYRFLTTFARQHKSDMLINQQDLNLIGRKLHSAFERKKGKIELINPNIAPDISEEHLTIMFEQDVDFQRHLAGWKLYSGIAELDSEKRPLRRSHSVLELIAWCYFNKIIDRTTRFHLPGYVDALTLQEIMKVVHRLEFLYPEKHVVPEQKVFKNSASIISLHYFVNLGMDPMESSSSRGIQIVTENTDAFKYSGIKTNLVKSIDELSINTWGEIIVNHFQEGEAIINSVEQYLREMKSSKSGASPQVYVDCFCASRADSIAARISELFQELTHCFFRRQYGEFARYILNIENVYYVIQSNQQHIWSRKYKTIAALLRGLIIPQDKFSPIVLDSHALQNSVLVSISNYMMPGNIQVFYHLEPQHAVVFVVDELGAVFNYNTHCYSESHFISHTYHFLRSTLDRMETDPSAVLRDLNFSDDPEFFQLTRVAKGRPYNLLHMDVYEHLENHNFLEVQAIIEKVNDEERSYTIFIDHQEFNQLEHGVKLFEEVAKHIISIRPSGSRYPCYITDLDISGLNSEVDSGGVIPLSQYMSYKQALELKINNAIAALR